jgi:NosR/NirI family transcriptional regulator, nitrous oxide reductase regulator
MNILRRYFRWLQSDNYTGDVDRFPVIDEHGQTSVPGLFVIGDLTGVPLLKLAAESGRDLVEHLATDRGFASAISSERGDAPYDLLIVGGGPSGISAAIEATRRGWRAVVIESSRPFSTIHNFPHGKPIYDEPAGVPQRAALLTPAGTKETLVASLDVQLAEHDPPVHSGETVESISGSADRFLVRTRGDAGGREYRARRVVLAIGRNGNPRRLGVDGEDLEKVANRLIDPAHHHDENVLVVGGGDSAVEAAIALAGAGNHVTLSYRGDRLARPKGSNVERIEELRRRGEISLLLESTVVAITPGAVRLMTNDGERELPNDAVYVLIGSQPAVELLRSAGVALRGEWNATRWLLLTYGVLFACVVYFGKKIGDWNLLGDARPDSLGALAGALSSGSFWSRFFSVPAQILSRLGDDAGFAWYSWRDGVLDAGAWAGSVLFMLATLGVAVYVMRRARSHFGSTWQTFKVLYFAGAAALFLVAFFGGKYAGYRLAGMQPSFWYTFLYSLTILVFGLRRMRRTPTRYVRLQTWTLIVVQVVPLFLLPEIILPALWKSGAIGPDSWLVEHVMPIQSWNNEPSFWRTYGLVLAWPLFIYNLFDGSPTVFWLIVSFVQTFVLIPLAVWKWGKGAYCGWICSCGGLAETLGDEYRGEALHGPVAKRWENLGQYVLAFVFLLTGAKLVSVLFGANVPVLDLAGAATNGERFYSVVVDILFAGVLGLGVYFFLSGRVWCRFACPLAALMHIYARFTRYRIFAAKERCISCNVCTSVCHMGIDVMGYANKGIPMNDVQCVRCSACVVSCPMDVLSFGELPEADPDNRLYLSLPIVQRPPGDWTSGRRDDRFS